MVFQSEFITNIKAIGIYLGSAMGTNPEFKNAVISLGEGLVEQGYAVVYGGASIGLMGLLAETVKKCGGILIGVITHHLIDKEIQYSAFDECIVVDSMHERKRVIQEKSERFLVMPGGIGTFDEAFETWCNIKIGLTQKPIDFLNINGFFDPLFHLMKSCQNEGFLSNAELNIPSSYQNVSSYLSHLRTLTFRGEALAAAD